jgi:hypothetical protein
VVQVETLVLQAQREMGELEEAEGVKEIKP